MYSGDSLTCTVSVDVDPTPAPSHPITANLSFSERNRRSNRPPSPHRQSDFYSHHAHQSFHRGGGLVVNISLILSQFPALAGSGEFDTLGEFDPTTIAPHVAKSPLQERVAIHLIQSVSGTNWGQIIISEWYPG